MTLRKSECRTSAIAFFWSLSVVEAPNIFTEKSRISAALNNRDFFEMLRMDRGGANEKARLQK